MAHFTALHDGNKQARQLLCVEQSVAVSFSDCVLHFTDTLLSSSIEQLLLLLLLMPLFAVAVAQAESGKSCPTGYFTPKLGAPAFPTATGYPSGQVNYAVLSSSGWAVPSVRPNRPTDTGPSSAVNRSADFYSVMCNQFGNVAANRTYCDTGGSSKPAVGEVHVRYTCNPKTLWVLVFMYKTVTLTETSDNWAVYTCTDTGNTCSNGGQAIKFLSFTGDKNSASCTPNTDKCDASRSTCTNGGTSCWCCQDVWPVVDGPDYVGWIGQASFTITGPNNTVASDYWLPHADWAGVGGPGTASAANGADGNMCLDCSGPGE